MKEDVEIGEITKTKTSITYQNFFPLYPKLCGMTGTAKTAEKELKEIYNLQVVVLPTAKPMLRKDLSDLVFQTELAKWKAVLGKATDCYGQGQPILIGTGSVEKSEFLSDLFSAANLPHQVLNAKPENINRESEIIAQAGEPYAITIATNMAGRGTDIILGGNITFKLKKLFTSLFLENKSIDEMSSEIFVFENKKEDLETLTEYYKTVIIEVFEEYKLKESEINQFESNNFNLLKNDILNLPYSLEISSLSFKKLYSNFYNNLLKKWVADNNFVKQVGGLFVLGTERHESRRIDNQLRGRAGRQGDPGFSQFFVSLDDELIKIFAGDSLTGLIKSLMGDEDTALESDYLTYSLENAQKKMESYNYDIRKNVFQYDELINLQRKKLFEIRKFILEKKNYNKLALDYVQATINDEKKELESHIFSSFLTELFFYQTEKTLGHFSCYKLNQMYQENNYLKGIFKKHLKFSSEFRNQIDQEILISADLRIAETNAYQPGYLQEIQSFVVLKLIDNFWTEHLERLNYIRETVNWRSYGQQNPLIEYNLEATKSFQAILYGIRKSVVYFYFEHPSMLFRYSYNY
jgi:preprotein translocase subunit SecA